MGHGCPFKKSTAKMRWKWKKKRTRRMGHGCPFKKSTAKMRWKWKKKRTRRLQRKRRKMRARAK